MSTVDTLLRLCARVAPQPEQQHLLTQACHRFSLWDELRYRAEKEGLGPLLHKHLATVEGDWPDTFYRGLMLSVARHRQANTLLMESLTHILKLLAVKGVPVIVLKGAALCQTLYPNIGLRPMRDIDLLLAEKDVHYVHSFLLQNGFHTYAAVMPADHFHLPPLYQSRAGIQICVELHHHLFPSCPPYYKSFSFAEYYKNGVQFDAGGVTAYMFAIEEMLYHIYEHGFHAPLTYEPYKLISVADVIGLVEKHVSVIDWDKVQSESPRLFHALPFLHFLTPWSARVLSVIPPLSHSVPTGVGGRFVGWPREKIFTQKNKSIPSMLYRTFFPPKWWVMMYYAPSGFLTCLWCRLAVHPKHIFWWVKLYWNIFVRETISKSDDSCNERDRWRLVGFLRNGRILCAAMVKKFR